MPNAPGNKPENKPENKPLPPESPLANPQPSRQARRQEDTIFRVMALLQENPDLTQRGNIEHAEETLGRKLMKRRLGPKRTEE